MQATATHIIDYNSKMEQRRYDRVERQYASQRQTEELVRDLLRAHSGE